MMHYIRIRGGRRQAKDREEWRHLLREVRVRKGIEHHTWMDGSCIRLHSAYVLPLMEKTKHHQASSLYKTSKIIVPYI